MVSDKGSLTEISIIKLVLSLFESGATGILFLKNKEEQKTLYFNRGKLIWAESNAEEDKLENIILTQGMIDPDVLMKTLSEPKAGENLGKLMVEKGLITLEDLIEASKTQLKRIIISILKWKEGGYYFVNDAPPERLLSLELNITDFIIDFILKEIDINQIWEAIDSLQVQLIKNPNQEKINKYYLSEKQKELLNNFTGESSLDSVLSKYSGGIVIQSLKLFTSSIFPNC